ncbi:MAG TPA: YceI family protein [Burkholderiales bacterium]|nr:YceI family protein [Burkholderiales bacterium]
MKLKIAYAAMGCALAASAFAAPETFNIDSPHTSANFEITHLGINTVPGRFDKTTGKIVLDREAKTGSIEAEIDVNTINTGFVPRDKLLKSDEYFNAEKFPTITFRATKLRFKGEDLTGADGEMTLLGVTKPVSLDLESFKCTTNPVNKRYICGAIAKATIKRADFGMTRASRSLGEEVKISINMEAIKG